MDDKELAKLKEWEFILRNLTDFVQIGKMNGIKFIVRTNENSGHHRPHLHVENASAQLSIAIDDYEVLACAGKITSGQIKKAQDWMKDNKDFITEKWNEFSNGIEISA